LRDLLGGDVLEYKAIDDIETLAINDVNLPAYQWKGFLKEITGTILVNETVNTVAIRNTYGKGMVYWVPTLAGLGSRILNDYTELNKFLVKALIYRKQHIPFIFDSPQKGVLIKPLEHGGDFVTIIINKSKETREFKLITPSNVKPIMLSANKKGYVLGNIITINAEETLVIKWS